MKLFLIFSILNILNVVIQTVKSIATIKCGKWAAALVNAGAYGLYTVVLVYMSCELNLWAKVAVVASANLVGVFTVKFFEEKSQKEKLWKVEATIKADTFETNKELLEMCKVPHNFVNIGSHYIVNFYCSTKKHKEAVKIFLNDMNAKYFVSETKEL